MDLATSGNVTLPPLSIPFMWLIVAVVIFIIVRKF